MPDFSLELLIPDTLPKERATSAFYWVSGNPCSFDTAYGPNLGQLGPVLPTNIDFVRIAVAIFSADRSAPRATKSENWSSRDIGVTVPVHEPERWEVVKADLEGIVGFLTGDTWRLTFVPTYGPEEPIADFEPAGITRVVLVSGGADSAIGALRSRQTIGPGGHTLVSHFGPTTIASIQKDVATRIGNLVPGVSQSHLQVRFNRRQRQTAGRQGEAPGPSFRNEYSSRSRSLLFLAFGLAIASRERVPLWIPENGFASINPPLGGERRGSLSTRTTHPIFLKELSRVLEAVGAQSAIENPFIKQTKGEMFATVAEEFGRDEASRFLSLTRSCGGTGQRTIGGVSSSSHCGVCFGCVVRRASFRASGVRDGTSYMDGSSGAKELKWLRDHSIESSVRSFVRRGVQPYDVAAMSLPEEYPLREALDLCQRGLRELGRSLFMRNLPSIDAHAHVDADIAPHEVRALGSLVLCMTRTLDEATIALARQDDVALWGVGCHPGLKGAQDAFDVARFERLIGETPLVGELGLDGKSRVPIKQQMSVLSQAFDALHQTPRLTSLHSYAATGPLLSLLEPAPPPGVILHWWLGNAHDTSRAVELGCFFSVNAAMVRRGKMPVGVPLDRMLTETDHPSGDRGSKPHRPGNVAEVEQAIGLQHGLSPNEVRYQMWTNFRTLVRTVGCYNALPSGARTALVAIP